MEQTERDKNVKVDQRFIPIHGQKVYRLFSNQAVFIYSGLKLNKIDNVNCDEALIFTNFIIFD